MAKIDETPSTETKPMTGPIHRSEVELIADRAADKAAEKSRIESERMLKEFFKENELKPEHWTYLRLAYEKEMKHRNWIVRSFLTTVVGMVCVFTAGAGENFIKSWILTILKSAPPTP